MVKFKGSIKWLEKEEFTKPFDFGFYILKNVFAKKFFKLLGEKQIWMHMLETATSHGWIPHMLLILTTKQYQTYSI